MPVDANLVKLSEFIKSDLARGKGVSSITETQDLVEAEVMDSLGIMKLILFLESDFGVKISDDDLTLENFTSVQTIYSLVQNKMKERGLQA